MEMKAQGGRAMWRPGMLLLLAVASATSDDEDDGGCVQALDSDVPGRMARSLVIFFVTAIQLIGLFYAHQRSITSWEPLWVLGCEAANYFMAMVSAGAGDLVLANGITVPWLRYVGWLATCPVLLMFLVTMTTYGGKRATVRLVPLLISNQVMILAGISASAHTGLVKWTIYLIAISFGCVVLTQSGHCLFALYQVAGQHYKSSGNGHERARYLTALMALSFLGGWAIFPLAYTLGEPGIQAISRSTEAWMMVAGDLLAKNAFSALAVYVKYRYLQPLGETSFRAATASSERAHPTPARLARRPSQIISEELMATIASRAAVSASATRQPQQPRLEDAIDSIDRARAGRRPSRPMSRPTSQPPSCGNSPATTPPALRAASGKRSSLPPEMVVSLTPSQHELCEAAAERSTPVLSHALMVSPPSAAAATLSPQVSPPLHRPPPKKRADEPVGEMLDQTEQALDSLCALLCAEGPQALGASRLKRLRARLSALTKLTDVGGAPSSNGGIPWWQVHDEDGRV